MKLRLLIGALFFLLLLNFSYGQPLQFRFENYSIKNGLSENDCGDICQDSRGFIWVTTQNGLNRFDGSSFQNFFHNAADSNSLPGNFVRTMTEVPGGLLVIGTNNGLGVFNMNKNRFENFRIKQKEFESQKNIFIRKIFSDADKNLWVNYNGVIDIYDSLLNYKSRFTDSQEGKILRGIVIDFDNPVLDQKNDLWIPSDNFGMVLVENKTKRVSCFKNSSSPLFAALAIRGLYLDSLKKNIWFSPWGGGLWRYNFTEDKLTKYYFPSENRPFSSSYNTLNGILPIGDKLLCGSESGGLFEFNPANGNVTIHIHDIYDPLSISSDEISRMFPDKENNLWISTAGGLSRTALSKTSFHYFSNEFRKKNNEPFAQLLCFTLYDSTLLVVGTESKGLFNLNKETEEVRQCINNQPLHEDENVITRLYVDHAKDVWAGTFSGLFLYDIEKSRLTRPEGVFSDLPNHEVSAIFQDSHNDYWFGYRASMAIAHYSSRENKLTKYYYGSNAKDFPLSFVTKIREDHDGNIWFSSIAAQGFVRWNRTENSFTHYPKTKSKDDNLSESISDLLPDTGNTVWLASSTGHGLMRYNYVTNTSENFLRNEGLCNEIVKSITRDKNGNLWLGTQNGLAMFDPVVKKFRNFEMSDGLPDNEFMRTSFFDSLHNLVCLLTPHAVVYFNPDDLKEKTPEQHLYIQRMQINGKDTAVDFSKSLQLSYRQNYFTIEYTTVNFKDGSNTRFEYLLEGFDKDWVDADKKRFASFTNIPGGDYTFMVRSSKGDEAWSEPTKMHIRIEPPFWSTWWFKIFIALFSAACIASVVAFYFRRRLNSEHRAYEQQQRINSERTRISNELHDDLGSGLTKIAMMGDLLKKNPEQEKNYLISRMSSSAHELVDNMNEIIWALNMRNDTLQNLVAHIHKYGYEYFDDTRIKLKITIPEIIPDDALSGEARRNIFLVVKEALHNISKHSRAETVTIHIGLREKIMVVNIMDDGLGFSTNYTGNGLPNMKQRMTEIGGEFAIYSPVEIGKGTQVSISFPFA